MSYFQPQQGVGALGSVDYNATQVWSDWVAGAPPSNNNAAGSRAAKAIQAALNEIGYGPIAVDGQFGKGSVAAWTAFAAANGIGGNWPTQAGVIKLGEQLNQGGDQGGNGVIDYHTVNGQYVPGSGQTGTTNQSNSNMMLGIGIAALVGIGLLAVLAKKRKQSGSSPETTIKA